MRTRILITALLTLALAACSSGATPAPSVEPTPRPSTAPAASPAPTPTAAVLDVKVTFDGETCTYLGPSVILDGTVMRFEFEPTPNVTDPTLLIYGVQPGTTYEMLLESVAADDADYTTDIPEWVYQETASWVDGAGSLMYLIESVKRGTVAAGTYAVGGYHLVCVTPAMFPAVQLSIAGPS